MVPHSTDLREEILREFHCSRFAVHPRQSEFTRFSRHRVSGAEKRLEM